MENTDRPLSQPLSSVQEVTPVEVHETPVEETVSSDTISDAPKEKKSNAFTIVVAIFLLLIVGAGGYYVYTQYFAPEEVEQTTEEESKDEDIVSMDLVEMYLVDQEKTLSVNAPTSHDAGYELIAQPGDAPTINDSVLYRDNDTGVGSTEYFLGYFVNEKAMTDTLSTGNAVYPLEKVAIDGVDYEYIEKVDYSTETGSGSGMMYKKEPIVKVGGYDAFEILSYYVNSEPSSTDNVLDGATVTTYCAFDLSKISSDVEGYLVFSGTSAAGSEINYCDMLNNTEGFSITVK